MKKLILIAIILIIFIGGFFRLYGLEKSPPSLNWDEASLGYNAYSIMLNGKDEYGTRFPLFLRSFDDYKSAIPAYLMIPAIKIFGLSEFGVRVVPALLSTLSIILIFLITGKIFYKDSISIIAALFYAIEPWSVHYARTYQEATVANFFLLLGITLFLYSNKIAKLFSLSIVALFLSLLSYHTNKFVVPIILLFIFTSYLKNRRKEAVSKKYLLLNSAIIIFFVGLITCEILNGHFFPRAASTSILKVWSNFFLVSNLNMQHTILGLEKQILHSPYILFAKEIIGRFMAYFSPANLFLREPLEPTSKIPGISIFYPFEFIFWVFGSYGILKKSKTYKYLLAFIFISIFPSALTWNWFQPNRVMSLFSVYSIIIAYGAVTIIEVVRVGFFRKVLYSGLIFYYLLNSFFLYDGLFVQIPIQNNGPWQPGFRETVPMVSEYAKNYEHIIVDTSHAQPYIFYLFYGKYDPRQYQKDILIKDPGTPRKVYDFGKYEFRKIDWAVDKELEQTLFVTSDSKLPSLLDLKSAGYSIFQPKDKNGTIVSTLVGTK